MSMLFLKNACFSAVFNCLMYCGFLKYLLKAFFLLISEMEKSDCKPNRSNHYLINALKSDPSLTKELRVVLEQALEEKLESLGIKAVR